jgi:hypothetical protein
MSEGEVAAFSLNSEQLDAYTRALELFIDVVSIPPPTSGNTSAPPSHLEGLFEQSLVAAGENLERTWVEIERPVDWLRARHPEPAVVHRRFALAWSSEVFATVLLRWGFRAMQFEDNEGVRLIRIVNPETHPDLVPPGVSKPTLYRPLTTASHAADQLRRALALLRHERLEGPGLVLRRLPGGVSIAEFGYGGILGFAGNAISVGYEFFVLNDEQYAFVRGVVEAKGNIVSFEDIKNKFKILEYVTNQSRLKKSLPGPLRDRIETVKGKGYRVKD